MSGSRPTVLLIEDDLDHALAEQIMLEAAGCRVSLATTVLDAETIAMQLLSPANAPEQMVGIVSDIKLHDLILRRMEGTLLLSILTARMLGQQIRPAPIVAISSDLTPQRHTEAINSGALLVLQKPLSLEQVLSIHDLILHPPAFPHFDPAGPVAQSVGVLQGFAERTLRDLQDYQLPMVWTEVEAAQLLVALTPYRPPKSMDFQADPHRQAILIRTLGGRDNVLQILQTCALATTEPTRTILMRYLQGQTLKEIVAELLALYHRSHVYRMSDSLPERVSTRLRHILLHHDSTMM